MPGEGAGLQASGSAASPGGNAGLQPGEQEPTSSRALALAA